MALAKFGSTLFVRKPLAFSENDPPREFWRYLYPYEVDLVLPINGDNDFYHLVGGKVTNEGFADAPDLHNFIQDDLSGSSSHSEEIPVSEQNLVNSDWELVMKCRQNNTHLTKRKRTLLLDLAHYVVEDGDSEDLSDSKRAKRLEFIRGYCKEVKRRRFAKQFKRFTGVRSQHVANVEEEANQLCAREMADKDLDREYCYSPNEGEEFKTLLKVRRKAVQRKYHKYATSQQFRKRLRNRTYHDVGLNVPASDLLHMTHDHTLNLTNLDRSLEPRTPPRATRKEESAYYTPKSERMHSLGESIYGTPLSETPRCPQHRSSPAIPFAWDDLHKAEAMERDFHLNRTPEKQSDLSDRGAAEISALEAHPLSPDMSGMDELDETIEMPSFMAHHSASSQRPSPTPLAPINWDDISIGVPASQYRSPPAIPIAWDDIDKAEALERDFYLNGTPMQQSEWTDGLLDMQPTEISFPMRPPSPMTPMPRMAETPVLRRSPLTRTNRVARAKSMLSSTMLPQARSQRSAPKRRMFHAVVEQDSKFSLVPADEQSSRRSLQPHGTAEYSTILAPTSDARTRRSLIRRDLIYNRARAHLFEGAVALVPPSSLVMENITWQVPEVVLIPLKENLASSQPEMPSFATHISGIHQPQRSAGADETLGDLHLSSPHHPTPSGSQRQQIDSTLGSQHLSGLYDTAQTATTLGDLQLSGLYKSLPPRTEPTDITLRDDEFSIEPDETEATSEVLLDKMNRTLDGLRTALHDTEQTMGDLHLSRMFRSPKQQKPMEDTWDDLLLSRLYRTKHTYQPQPEPWLKDVTDEEDFQRVQPSTGPNPTINIIPSSPARYNADQELDLHLDELFHRDDSQQEPRDITTDYLTPQWLQMAEKTIPSITIIPSSPEYSGMDKSQKQRTQSKAIPGINIIPSSPQRYEAERNVTKDITMDYLSPDWVPKAPPPSVDVVPSTPPRHHAEQEADSYSPDQQDQSAIPSIKIIPSSPQPARQRRPQQMADRLSPIVGRSDQKQQHATYPRFYPEEVAPLSEDFLHLDTMDSADNLDDETTLSEDQIVDILDKSIRQQSNGQFGIAKVTEEMRTMISGKRTAERRVERVSTFNGPYGAAVTLTYRYKQQFDVPVDDDVDYEQSEPIYIENPPKTYTFE